MSFELEHHKRGKETLEKAHGVDAESRKSGKGLYGLGEGLGKNSVEERAEALQKSRGLHTT